jgi:hypothetical protein
VNITKPKFAKWHFVEVTDKEMSEIEINSAPKNTKQLFASGSVIIWEYLP